MTAFIRGAARRGSLAVIAASLVLAGGDVFAAHTVGRTGVTGHYAFVDTPAAPGAKCFYAALQGQWEFNYVRVKPPKVYWPTSSAFSSGTVGFTVRLQHWNGLRWTTVNASRESRAVGSKTIPAPFSARTVMWAPPHDRRYRAEVRLRWLTPDATVIGKALVVLDNYRIGYSGTVGSACRAEAPISQ